MQILGSLDGIETGVRQLIRKAPLEVNQIEIAGEMITLPYDLDEVNLAEYKSLDPRWHEWQRVCAVAIHCAVLIFDRITGLEA